MNETIINYLHIAPLLIMSVLVITNQLWPNNKFFKYVRKNFISIQLLLISVGVLFGTIFHSHEGMLGCNICLIYSALLVCIAFRLLYTNTNDFKHQGKQRLNCDE